MLENSLLKIFEVGQMTDSEVSQRSMFCQDPYRLHLLVMSSFFENWRWYFRSLGDTFAEEVCTNTDMPIFEVRADESQNNLAMIIKPEAAKAQESFSRVKALRNMNDFALFAKACCSSNLELVEKLKCSVTPLKDSSSLESQKTVLRGHVESSNVLEGRIRNAIDLVGVKIREVEHDVDLT